MSNNGFFTGDNTAWFESGCLRPHDKYIAVKCEDKSGRRKESVFIPTDKWPLNGPYEVFHYLNTEWLQPDKYPDIAAAFDVTEYKIGFCYDNTNRLVSELKKRGVPASAYTGWLFISGTQYPIHHCWCVVETADGKGVLDLCDDCTVLVGLNGQAFEGANLNESRSLLVDFASYVKKHKIPNSERCMPLGQPFPSWVYIGCPCDPEEGRSIYQKLVAKYPKHECKLACDNRHLSVTQQELHKRGLMPFR